jgi:hypothetical protein
LLSRPLFDRRPRGNAPARGGDDGGRNRPAARSLGRKDYIRRTPIMIRKLPSGKYRLYSRKLNPKTGKRRNLGTFASRAAAEKHERAVQYFKRH